MNTIFESVKVGIYINTTLEGFKTYPFINYEAQQYAYAKLMKENPRKKNIYTGKPKINGGRVDARFEIINYKGAFRGYKGSNLYCDYQSAIAISDCGKYAITIIGNVVKRKYISPKGMLFKRDDLGILVERQSDKMDYHLSDVDWNAKNFATNIRSKMAIEYIKRQLANRLKKANEKQEKLFIKSLGNTRVNLNDSCKAGNCIEGTLSFCEKYLKLDRKTILDAGYLISVPAIKILKMAKNTINAERAMNACRIAWMRETTISI